MGENKTMKSFFIGMFFCGEIRRPDYMVAQFYELFFFFLIRIILKKRLEIKGTEESK